MPNRQSRRLLIGALLLCGLSGCSDTPTAQRWEVLLLGIPEEVVASRAPETSTYYILKQTHEPLFRRADSQNYSSRLLKSWSRDLTAKEYVFCPDTSLRFDAENRFDLEYFRKYLQSVTGRYSKDYALKSENECFRVVFPYPRKGYLDALILYDNSPSVSKAPGIETGLGPFYVDSISKDKITLLRKKRVRNGYNEIVIREFDPVRSSEYKYSVISDFNKLMSSDVPDSYKSDYQGFNNIQLRSNVLMINHPDRAVRRQIYNCLDVERFRSAFLPQTREFYNIATILPVGVPGSVPGKPEQACKKNEALKGKEVVLYNHRPGNRAQMEKFAAEFSSRAGLVLKIVYCTPQELVRVLHRYPRPFNLTVLALDTVYPEYLTFFDCFVRDDGYFDFKLPRISKLYSMLADEDDPDKKTEIAKDILSELSEEAVALPLSQDNKMFYYPKKIKNLHVGRGFMEYPEVAEFKW